MSLQEITSYWLGYDVDQFTLLDRITRMGWKVDKIEEGQDGYQAKLKNDRGANLTFKGNTVETALAQALIHLLQIAERHRHSSLQKTFTHLLPDIAKAYVEAPVFDYKSATNWKAAADDNAARAEKLKNELEVEYTHEPVPYSDNWELAKDISKGKIKIPLTDIRHPIWTPSQHLDHRLVHAVLGQAPAGGIPNWPGTNMAFSHHAPYLSDHAKSALFTETIGRSAYLHHYGMPGPKKIADLGFLQGSVGDDMDNGESISETRVPWTPKMSSLNSEWESGIDPPFDNIFLLQDPLDYMKLREDAQKTHRRWQEWERTIDV